MGKAIPMKLGNKLFKTKQEVSYHFKNMLHSYKVGDILNEEDRTQMFDLLLRHPNFYWKMSKGIKDFKVGLSYEWKKPAFEIIQDDGCINDFSYIKCIKGKDPTRNHMFNEACREAVSVDIIIFKKEFFKNHPNEDCPVTNMDIGWGNCQVDHVAPMVFRNIIRKFVYTYDIDINEIDVPLGVPGATRLKFSDRSFAKKFKVFHKEHATLRMVSPMGNSISMRLDKKDGVYDILTEDL